MQFTGNIGFARKIAKPIFSAKNQAKPQDVVKKLKMVKEKQYRSRLVDIKMLT